MKKIIIIAAVAVAAIGAAIGITIGVLESSYSNASTLLSNGSYEEAASIYSSINFYRNSTEMVLQCSHDSAVALMNAKKYDEALNELNKCKNYSDTQELIKQCNSAKERTIPRAQLEEDTFSFVEKKLDGHYYMDMSYYNLGYWYEVNDSNVWYDEQSGFYMCSMEIREHVYDRDAPLYEYEYEGISTDNIYWVIASYDASTSTPFMVDCTIT